MQSTTNPTDDAETAAFTSTKGVLLITNEDQVPDDNYAYTFALTLAAKTNVPVTLYDRSEETWGDSQHPEGPLRAGDKLLADRDALATQIAWLDEHLVSGQGWVATLPSISAVLTALAQIDADVVVVPESLKRNLFERALEGTSLAETLAEQISRNGEIQAVVFEVADSGAVALVES